MKVFVSHAHEENILATALNTLIESISDGLLDVWYSSDRRPQGGIDSGDWRKALEDQIVQSNIVLAILSRNSNDRPWILWECGVASAQNNEAIVIPLLYDLPAEKVSSPLAVYQSYVGSSRESMIEFLGRILDKVNKQLDPEDEHLNKQLDYYFTQVEEYFEKDIMNRVFSFEFHVPDQVLEGMWSCEWYNDDGDLLVEDAFEIHNTPMEARIIGHVTKRITEFDENMTYYAVQGKFSKDRILTIIYWNVYGGTLTGSAIVKLAPSGLRMVGRWMGYTTDHGDNLDLDFTSGKLVLKKQTG